MITVHHLNNSRSHRVLWLLEELEIDYDLVLYTRDPATMRAPDALKAVHPLGKAPVLVEDGVTLAESGAIIEHVLHRHGAGRLAPEAGTEAWREYVYWLHYAEGSVMPQLTMKLVFDVIEDGPLPWLIRPLARALARGVKARVILPELVLHLDHMEAALERAPWFAGQDFTAADIQMSFPVQGAAARAGLDQSRPRLIDWLARITARPAWQRAVGRGGELVL
jgi:glutathione S-transferase